MTIKIIKENKFRMPVGVCYQANGESREMQRLINSGIAVEITQKEFETFVRRKQLESKECDDCKKKKTNCKKCNEVRI